MNWLKKHAALVALFAAVVATAVIRVVTGRWAKKSGGSVKAEEAGKAADAVASAASRANAVADESKSANKEIDREIDNHVADAVRPGGLAASARKSYRDSRTRKAARADSRRR